MGDSSELTLNLCSDPSEAPKYKKRKQPSDQEHASEEPPNQDSEHVHKKKRASEGSLAPPSEVVVSSLFSGNPTVPRLQSATVVPVAEAVFSERSFTDSGIHPFLAKNLKDWGFSEMTEVQRRTLPVVLEGKDALVKSQTGSGKTLAYALPIVHKLQEIRPALTRADGIHALIIVPTRELAAQTLDLLNKLCRTFDRLVPCALAGGEKKKSEKARLRKGVNILVATPGRLLDHLSHTKCLSLRRCAFLVLDEADRCLELGYERDVQAIMDHMKRQGEEEEEENEQEIGEEKRVATVQNRQTILLSATLTTGIEELSKVAMKHPVFVDAASDSSAETPPNDSSSEDKPAAASEPKFDDKKSLTCPDNLKQNFIICPGKLRLVSLAALLLWKCRFSRPRKVLIFMSTQDMVDYHLELFQRTLNNTSDDNDNNRMKRKKNRFGKLEVTDDARELMESGEINEEEEEDDYEEEERARNEEVDVLTGHARGAGAPVTEIELMKLHGSMTQQDRMSTFNRFKEATAGVLICTDVAARGLDLPQVDWIVQYNPPTSKADYVHRVGRTARIGSKGSSLIFLLPSEAGFVRSLEEEQLVLAEMTLEQLLTRLPGGRMEAAATGLQMKMENEVVRNEEMHKKASQAYVSYVRSYASYPKDIRHVFCFKDLHLGHIAKSYALRDPPSSITGLGGAGGNWVKTSGRKEEKERRVKRKEEGVKKRPNQKRLVVSEFSSGFDGIDLGAVNKPKKAKKVNFHAKKFKEMRKKT